MLNDYTFLRLWTGAIKCSRDIDIVHKGYFKIDILVSFRDSTK